MILTCMQASAHKHAERTCMLAVDCVVTVIRHCNDEVIFLLDESLASIKSIDLQKPYGRRLASIQGRV